MTSLPLSSEMKAQVPCEGNTGFPRPGIRPVSHRRCTEQWTDSQPAQPSSFSFYRSFLGSPADVSPTASAHCCLLAMAPLVIQQVSRLCSQPKWRGKHLNTQKLWVARLVPKVSCGWAGHLLQDRLNSCMEGMRILLGVGAPGWLQCLFTKAVFNSVIQKQIHSSEPGKLTC